MVQIKLAYQLHEPVNEENSEPSLTKQAFASECEIENIMAKYERTGICEHLARVNGQYGDFISAPAYQEALNAVIEAKSMFDALSAKIRAKFANDPVEFLGFVQNPENLDEMISLGLAVAKPSQNVPVVEPEKAVV